MLFLGVEDLRTLPLMINEHPIEVDFAGARNENSRIIFKGRLHGSHVRAP